MSVFDVNAMAGSLDDSKHNAKSRSRSESLQGSNSFLQQISNIKTVVRSKSSFALNGIASLSPVSMDESTPRKKNPTVDKFFKDFLSAGFSGMWNHPMTRFDQLGILLTFKNEKGVTF